MTDRLYLADAYLRAFDARVVASADGWCRLDRSAFYPGGGGQPADRGALVVAGERLAVDAVRDDDAGEVWHHVGRDLAEGAAVQGELDWPWRYALMRNHALMHVVNAVARERLGGVITGVQIGDVRSRIDLRLPAFAREQIAALEGGVDEVLARALAVSATTVSEAEFHARPELVRTLDVRPPVIAGRVRVVEIAGFDAQACGGTHVHSTAEIGRARVVKYENKGKDNKRFYWELTAPPG